MKLATQDEVALPRDQLFAALCDFSRFERQALDAGVDLRRTDSRRDAGPGMGWRAEFMAQGKDRVLLIGLQDWQPPQGLIFAGQIGGIEGQIDLVLVPLGPSLTRLEAVLHLKARSLPARVLLQSMKLARSSVMQRFRKRLRKLCRQIEQRALVPA